MTTHVRREIYIGSGLKNGFYTLRSHTYASGADRRLDTDIYLRNLSTDPDKAEAKARAYYDRVYGESCLDVVFMGFADFDLTPWGRGLEPYKLRQLHAVDSRVWPFGKHAGAPIESAEDGYLMYWATQQPGDDVVLASLVEVCRSIADDRGVTARYEERRAARQAEREYDALVSKHVGKVGERREFDVTVTFKTRYETAYGYTYVYVCRDTDGNVVVFKVSKPLGLDVDSQTFREADRDSRVVVVASVKCHAVRDNVRQTVVQRPKVKLVERAA